MESMFVLISRYTVPMDVVRGVAPEHGDWVAAEYARGRIVVSGRRDPWEGGVLVVRGESVDEVRAWIADDPLVLRGVAAYEITAFEATEHPKRSPALDVFLATLRTAATDSDQPVDTAIPI